MNKQASGQPGGCVLTERRGRVAYVSLSHPGRLNALTISMWRQVEQVFDELSADTGLRCVVLSGEGGNFAAGADIAEFPQARADQDGVMHYHLQVIAPALKAVAACPHPVVARIEGVCVGGGLELASQCDLRIAAKSSRFGVPINKLGFPMAPDEMQGLLALAGRAATLEILLEGRVFGADEAMAKGLLTRVVPDADLSSDVARLVGRLENGAAMAARLNKQMVARLSDNPDPLSEAELRSFFSYAPSRDHREGVEAFLAGREPVFSGD
jgi:enoyl-CoA hydratase